MWGTVSIGGVLLREEITVTEDGDTVKIAGQESTVTRTRADVRSIQQNIAMLKDRMMPAVFSDKTHLTGFYRVNEASAVMLDFANGALVACTWTITLGRIGTGRDVEFESRLLAIPRVDQLTGTQTASFWHAPPIGTKDYFTGATVPSVLTRASEDGPVTTYTGLPSQSPRWTVSAEEYLKGSVRVLLDGIRRIGTRTPAHASWELSNGLVRLSSGSGHAAGFDLSVWRGAPGWSTPKTFRPMVSGAMLTAAPEVTILRNEPEEATIRLSYPASPGRVTLDLTLRRGGRFVTAVMKRHAAATLELRPHVAEAGYASPVGGVVHAATGEAVKTFLGSASNATVSAVGGLSKATVTALDLFIGAEVDAAPQVGDAFADLLLQYLGTNGDLTRVVRR